MSSALRPDAVVPDGEINQAECTVCVDLTAAHRLVTLSGRGDLIYAHLSATTPGETDHFLISIFGLAFDEITASNLVKINGRDQLVDDWPEDAARPPVNAANFALHTAVHATRPDTQCVVHLHNTADIAVSAQKHGLLPLSQYTLRFHRRVAYHGYKGPAFMPEEGTRLTASLNSRFAILLRDHGTLTIDHIVAKAYVLMATLIKAYEIQIQIQIQAQAGGEVVSSTPHVAGRATEQLEDGDAIESVIEWPALLRKLDKIDTSYRN